MGVATIHMYLRTHYEGVAKHMERHDTITMAEQRTAFKGSSSPIKGVHMVLMSSNYTGFLVRLATSLACHAYALTARAHLCRPVPTMYTALIVFINAGLVLALGRRTWEVNKRPGV